MSKEQRNAHEKRRVYVIEARGKDLGVKAFSTYDAIIQSHTLCPICQGTGLRLSGVKPRLFIIAHRMAMLMSDTQPKPLDLKRLASRELPIVFHAHFAFTGPSFGNCLRAHPG